jgi:hypothetical protein
MITYLSPFVFRVVLLGVVCAPLLFNDVALAQSQSDKDRIEAEAREAERERRQREIEDARTRQLIEGFMASAREARDMLAGLETRATRLLQLFQDLLSNDDGKRLAQDKLSFFAYLRIRDEPPISMEQIKARKKQAESILSGLEAELKRPSVGWLPDDKQRRDVDGLYFWAKERMEQVERQESLLASAISRSPKDIDLANSKTLQEVIQEHETRMLEAWIISKAQGEEAAQKEGQEKVRESARIALLEKAALEAERLLQEERANMASLKAEFELMLKQREIEELKRRTETETQLADLAAEIARLKQLADAQRFAKDAEAKVAATTTISEAEKKLLIQKCNEPEVKSQLAPFLAAGYTQPGEKQLQYDKAPISYSKLVSFGALNPDRQGLCQLLDVATAKNDKARPRWSVSAWRFEQLKPDEIERYKKAQQLLIELGPTMVELGMLQP